MLFYGYTDPTPLEKSGTTNPLMLKLIQIIFKNSDPASKKRTTHLQYKDQLVNAVWRSNRLL
jgi:hypothetical protein